MARESVDTREAKLLGQALHLLRRRAALSQEEAGKRYVVLGQDGSAGGISREGWRKYESGMAKAIFSPETQLRLTAAVGATPEDLLAERARLAGEDAPLGSSLKRDLTTWAQARTPELTLLPIRDTVQAGAWLMADDHRQDPSNYPAARDPRFPQAHQWLSEVRGDSVNLLNIFEGDLGPLRRRN